MWSENNWSSFGKQFSKTREFPLPGQTGLVHSKADELEANDNFLLALNNLLQKQKKLEDNLNQFESALPRDKHLSVIMQAQVFQNATDEKKRDERLNAIYTCFELKAFKCPTSLLKGIY